MKLITILLSVLLLSCASPPRVVNDPNIPDNGQIILNINNGVPYQHYNQACDIYPYTDPNCLYHQRNNPYNDPNYRIYYQNNP